MTGNGRHEIKYSINNIDRMELKRKLPYIMKSDRGGYRVTSLYFDNYRDKALMEKIYGLGNREKFRFRYYNGDFSFIRLEKKSKKNSICYKDSVKISKSNCERILNGNYAFLKYSDKPLLVEFYSKLISEQLRPKNIVEYDREAYLFREGNVRVTIDRNIRKSLNTVKFFNDFLLEPLPKDIILEVKFDSFLPDIISKIVSCNNRSSSAFSKYVAARLN